MSTNGDAVDELRVEPELRRQSRIRAEIVLTRRRRFPHAPTRQARADTPAPTRSRTQIRSRANELVDLRDRREPGIPGGAGVVAAERLDELA